MKPTFEQFMKWCATQGDAPKVKTKPKAKAKKKPVAPEDRKTPSGKPWFVTDGEKAEIVALKQGGASIESIIRKTGRSGKAVRQILRDAPIQAPTVVLPPEVVTVHTPEGVQLHGIESMKRSLARLHDKQTALEGKVDTLNSLLRAAHDHLFSLQKTADKIVRATVETNLPPPEIVLSTQRNGHAQ